MKIFYGSVNPAYVHEEVIIDTVEQVGNDILLSVRRPGTHASEAPMMTIDLEESRRLRDRLNELLGSL